MEFQNYNEALKIKERISKDLFESDRSIELFESFRMTESIGGADNILGVGIGLSKDKYVVRLFTEFEGDYNLSYLKENYNIEDAHSIEYVAVGKIELQTRNYIRPTPPGWSIGHVNVTAGTLGVWTTRGNNYFVLSNNHVLANNNNASVGDHILQPGFADGGKLPVHAFAVLSDFEPINFNGANYMDAAIASASKSDVKKEIPVIGHVNSHIAEEINMKVEKYGRTTMHTEGIIKTIKTSISVTINNQKVLFKDVMIIERAGGMFSDGGDSGSLIVDKTRKKAVGLLFAGNSKITLASPIAPILNRFNVKLV